MKNNILKIIVVFATMLFVWSGCQEPDDLTPSVSRAGINSLTASFMDDDSSENLFTGEIDYENGVITVVFPYNYPTKSERVLTLEDLTKMRVKANLDDNVILSPPILYMDFTKENYITITDQAKNKKQYQVVAAIRKSAAALITGFELAEFGLSGVVNQDDKTISIVAFEPIANTLATVDLSYGATMSPDPTKEELNYNVDQEITVTAQDGTSKTIYTLRVAVPSKTELGMRLGSGKILWAKKLQSDLGIDALNVTGGIAATQNHLVVNTRGESSIYLNRRTGEKEGTLNMSGIVGGLKNFYTTADDDDNILVCNLTPNDGSVFKIWKIAGVTATPEVFIEYDSGLNLGRKISVKGSIDKDAIITAPILAAGNQFLRWEVKGGTLLSPTPATVTISGIEASWGNNCDVVYSDPSNVSSDYFAAYYAKPYKLAWVNGSTHAVKSWGPEISGNWIPNAVDYVVFNNNPYVVHNTVNSFTWGSDDRIFLHDASSGSAFETSIWNVPAGIYGGKDNAGQNGNGTGDVALKLSKDGYYMYLYFMFTNGQVVCVQFDCIDI